MSTKKLIIGGVICVVAATIIFGVDSVRSHIHTLRTEVKGVVRQAAPDDYEEARIQNLISDMSRKIMVYRDKLNDLSDKVATEKRDVAELKKQLHADRTALAAEREMLAQKADVYDIHGVSYTHEQVEASASSRLSRCKTNETRLETKAKVTEHLGTAIAEGRRRLDAAVLARDEQLHQLEVLRTRRDNARLQKEIADLAEPLRDTALRHVDSELAASIKAYEERIRTLERENELTKPAVAEPQIIPHDGKAENLGLLDKLDEFLLEDQS